MNIPKNYLKLGFKATGYLVRIILVSKSGLGFCISATMAKLANHSTSLFLVFNNSQKLLKIRF